MFRKLASKFPCSNKYRQTFSAFEANTGCAHPLGAKMRSSIRERDVPLINQGVEQWYGEIDVGTPPQTFNVSIDSGSTDNSSPLSAMYATYSFLISMLVGPNYAFDDGHFKLLAEKSDGLFEWARLTAYISGRTKWAWIPLLDLLKADAHPYDKPERQAGHFRHGYSLYSPASLQSSRQNMSLTCGLDYYTSIIYEAIVEAPAPPVFAAKAESPAPAPSKLKSSKKAKADDGEEDESDESQVGVGSIAAGTRSPTGSRKWEASVHVFVSINIEKQTVAMKGFSPMGSLLSGTTNSCTLIRPLHASFHDFLTNKSFSGDFFVEVSKVARDLAFVSLRVMEPVFASTSVV
ncbi:hypothetical protein EV424DRAFT_1541489 [Suillus variegatus]|nr:hypothetical protein EV424DRAFT_1541489 [Suillus variegatus]